jgi:flavorubredoxin
MHKEGGGMAQESRILYEDDEHQLIWFGWEGDDESNSLVQSNQLLIVNGDTGYLVDPGGAFIFREVSEVVARYLPLNRIEYLLATHQDPDVLSSVTLWLQTTPARLYISKLWTRFVSHFGFDDPGRIQGVPDEGGRLTTPSGSAIVLIPAHFLHSEGNFAIYDGHTRTLFSGDIGAAVFGPEERYQQVTDFASHIPYMEGFHRRYMANNAACRHWVDYVSRFPIDRIVPQHGAWFEGEQVDEFLAWLRELECGTDRIETLYDRPGRGVA